MVLENFAHNLEADLPQTQIKNVIIANVGEMFGFIKGSLINFFTRKVKIMMTAYNINHAISFREALQKGQEKSFQPVQIKREDIAFFTKYRRYHRCC